MRRSVPMLVVLAAAAAAGVGAGVVPALGADQTVQATPKNLFTPATVTIAAGDQVTFHNSGGFHNLHFEDETASRNQATISAWTITRRFETTGRVGFFCDIHSEQGMKGTVVVEAAGTPPPAHAAFTARPARDHFCTRRGATCKRPGVFLRVSAGAAGRVTGTLQRRPLRTPRSGRYRSDGRVRFSVPVGASKVTLLRRVDRRRIAVGDYRLTLRAANAKPVVVRFFVRPS